MGICSSALSNAFKLDISRYANLAGFDPFEGHKVADSYTPREVAIRACLGSLLSKFQPKGKAAKLAEGAALNAFLVSNEKCRAWRAPVPDNTVDEVILGEFRNFFAECFELPGGNLVDFWGNAAQFARVGPGSAVMCADYDFISKMVEGPLSVTSHELYWHYFNECLPFGLELESEIERSSRFPTPVVEGSKLGFAPKKLEIARTTCAEPGLNMFFQLGTGSMLEDILLKRYNVDLSTQPQLNVELARRGSLSGNYATADLTGASDSMSRGLWLWAQPHQEIREWFALIRSPTTVLPNGKTVELRMLSSMGNGFTFPLMTLLLTCAVQAVYKVMGIDFIRNHLSRDGSTLLPGNWAVFGDDIIVVERAYDTLVRVLGYLGFEVNLSKSYHKSLFRESCGGDFFGGRNVRGVYCKTLDAPHNRYALINRLNAWSAEWEIPIPNTIRLLMGSVWRLPVPPYESEDSGVITPFSCLKDKDIIPAKRSKDHKKPWYQGSLIYARMIADPDQWVPSCSPLNEPRNKRELERQPPQRNVGNAAGVLLAAVKGYLRDGVVTIRDDNIHYKKRLVVCPGWAYSTSSQGCFSPAGWANFEKRLASVNFG